ncbi:hypothetical protein [Paraclostridium sordellii]|uniref:hypothetical protein n=1 Tax=Paraclostridium sordellii TaxID=1505 RepID=UPI000C762A81|nr:hypothetical protein [Paeniclostridium sordellii]AUN14695.1 hypothetical protein RSJ16_10885 [Paeniclostridium sordellii]MDU5019975.1 hypothetical protein [Clostridiales bacterium]
MNWNFDEKHLEIAKVLVERIKEGQVIDMEQTITYGELGRIVKLPILTLQEREVFGRYLGQLSNYCHKNKMPLISAMVVRKPTKDDINKKYNKNKIKIDIPGSGFYNLYEDLRGISVNDESEKAIEFYKELKLIKEYNDWDRLIELLEEKIYPKPKILTFKKKKANILNRFTEAEEKVDYIEIDEFVDIERIEIEEGEHIQRIVKCKKRNSNARKLKLEKFKQDNDGQVFCEVCKENDIAVIDIHHNSIAVAKMEGVHKTKLSDLRVLCSNCHRKVHYYDKDVDNLIKEHKN